VITNDQDLEREDEARYRSSRMIVSSIDLLDRYMWWSRGEMPNQISMALM
jgi:hypothetical protein